MIKNKVLYKGLLDVMSVLPSIDEKQQSVAVMAELLGVKESCVRTRLQRLIKIGYATRRAFKQSYKKGLKKQPVIAYYRVNRTEAKE